MSSCAASSCMCFPKALSAFATLASSPTGVGPLFCRFAFNYSEQYRHRRPNQKPPLPTNPTHFVAVPNVAAAWWSSKDLRLLRSNSVLRPLSPESPHETTAPTFLTRCVSPPTGVVRPSHPKPPLPFQPRLQLSLLSMPTTKKTILRSLFSCSSTCSRSFSHHSNTIQFA